PLLPPLPLRPSLSPSVLPLLCYFRASVPDRVENCYVFKSRLQEYAQKAGLMTPEYQTLKEGPSHEPIFKSSVVINNVKYDSLPGFFSRKAAEQSAAEVALMEIGKSVALPTNATIPAVQETGLCKNLLQEYAQKMNYAIPSYICNKQGPYICTVEIGGIQYIGATARTKKEAEIKAARTALLAIQGQSEGCANGTTKYIVVPGKRQAKEIEKKPVETPKSLKTKKGGFKKQRNKNKFIKKNGQVNEE
uniref:DRBM domain-containing protein n=1 Tax=Aegilops tauschii subsp. strangulata TaxID=200361 RepID=A0A453KDQ5_AEGTS